MADDGTHTPSGEPNWEALAHHFADQLVDHWHSGERPVGALAVHMGLTWEQYKAWVEGRFAEVLPDA